VELIIAPGFDDDALLFLKNKSKDIRILELPMDNGETHPLTYHYIAGGMLVQSRNTGLYEKWKLSQRSYSLKRTKTCRIRSRCMQAYKSNAVVIAREYEKDCFQILAIGAGQPNRVDAIKKLAATKAVDNLKLLYELEKPDNSEDDFIRNVMSECVMASDAFFPFDDSIVYSAENHIRYIVSPGGSIRDKEVIEAADRLGFHLCLPECDISCIDFFR